MEKKLSAWCKNAKIEMINRDLKTTTLAKELSKVRSADHIRENEIRKEHASQPKLRKLPERWW